MRQRAYAALGNESLVDRLHRLAGGENHRFALAVAFALHRGEAAALQSLRGSDMDCPRCHAAGAVQVRLAQVRSADEGETAFHRCRACDQSWTV